MILIEKYKLARLFKKQPEGAELVPLEDVVNDRSNSVVGYLMESLAYVSPAKKEITGVKDFMERFNAYKKIHTLKLSKTQIKELIFCGVFGDPEQAFTEYCKEIGQPIPEDVDPIKEFKKRMKTKARASKAEIEAITDLPLTSLGDFIHPTKFGHNMHLAGWAQRTPTFITTKKGDPAAFLDIVSIEDADVFEERIISVCVWSRSFGRHQESLQVIHKGDLVSVLGTKSYNELKHKAQIDVPPNGWVKKLDV